MTVKSSLSSIISEQLPNLDSVLASGEVALKERPLRAAMEFARLFILKVNDGRQCWKPDLDSPGFLSEKWFRALYREIEDWYRKRYKRALPESTSRTVTGLVLIWSTPFALRVPVSLTRPGKPGQTAWLSCPDSVLDSEKPTDWLVTPPDLSQMSAKELAKVTASCREIASLLRSINVRLMGISPADSTVRGFLAGVKLHVEWAAEHILQRQEGSTSRAYWEVQMACESAYKALLQQKTGTFLKTHDLFGLHDKAAPHHLPLKRDMLKRLPRWKTMIELRYGQTLNPTVAEYYKAYCVMLRIVEAVLGPIVTLKLGKASFELAKAPWLRDDDLALGNV